MALSNIRKEPQREITESLVGITGLAVALWLDYEWARWFEVFSGGAKDGCPRWFGLFVFPLLLGILFLVGTGILYGTHALGELICGALARRGLELRPRVRK